MQADTGAPRLDGLRVAVLVADGFAQTEFDGPVSALRQAGARVEVLAPDVKHLEHIRGVHHFEPGLGIRGDRPLSQARPEDHDALFVPGGLASPDTMRQLRAHLDFVRAMVQANRPIAMICHGPWLLADAEMARGRTLTSWPGIRRDLERAGARWEDREVVVDGNLVTSRKPADVPAFSRQVVETFAKVRQPVGSR